MLFAHDWHPALFTPMYKGARDPRVLFEALATVGR
jgi:hypothetical protein